MKPSQFNGRWLKPSVRFFRSTYLHILLATVLAAFSSISLAAPVTLQFDAVVGRPRPTVVAALPPSWNTSLQQGDTITGNFTFEPLDAPPNTYRTELVAPFSFSIRVNSHTLTTSQYGIEVLNNATSIEDVASTDHIYVGCAFFGGPKVCTPRYISPNETVEWSFGISFAGDPTAIDGPDVPADPSVWQRLAFADSMTVTFVDGAQRYYGFVASPRSFQVVPEPGACMLIMLGALASLLSSRFGAA